MSMDWRETMQRMLVRMEEAGQWPAVCEEARAVLEAENEPSREPAAYLWGGCLWRTDEMERGRPGAAELYRAQTPMTDAEIAALLPTWQRGSWRCQITGDGLRELSSEPTGSRPSRTYAACAGMKSIRTIGNTAARRMDAIVRRQTQS
jgi:hypothetical protein